MKIKAHQQAKAQAKLIAQMKKAGIINENYKTPSDMVQGALPVVRTSNSQTATRQDLTPQSNQFQKMLIAKQQDKMLSEMRDPVALFQHNKFKIAALNFQDKHNISKL